MPSASPTEAGLARMPGITGASLYVLGGLLAAALIWAHLTQVDVAVRAPGVVRPEGDLVRVTSELGGMVGSVHRSEGALVRAGDSLLRLEDPEDDTELETVARQIALLLESSEDLHHRMDDRASIYRLEVIELEAEIRSARDDLGRRRAEHDAARWSADIRLERARREYLANLSLFEAGLASRQSSDRALAEFRLAEAADLEVKAREPTDAALKSLIESAGLLRAVFESDLRSLEAEAAPIASELARLRSEEAKARLRRRQRTVRSPAHGRITYFSRIHPGEYLPPGTLVATLAPTGSAMVVEALVANREAENVHRGQAARLITGESVTLDGLVSSVSPDALLDESAAGAYRVVIAPNGTGLRLGVVLDVRLITHTESLLSLLFRRITRSVEDWAGG